MHRLRQDKGYKAKGLVAQLKCKQKARQDRDYKAKELVAQRKHKHKARQDRDYKAKELVAQQNTCIKPGKIEITKQNNW